MYFLFLLFALSCATLASCGGNDDDGGTTPGNGSAEIGGQSFDLTNGFVDFLGQDFDGTFDIDITLTNTDDLINGNYNIVYIDLRTDAEFEIEEGTYTYSEDFGNVMTFVSGGVALNTSFVNIGTFGPQNVVDGGTVEISRSGNNYTITFDFEMLDGSTSSGEYRGPLIEI